MIAPHEIVDAWLRDGRPTPLPHPTLEHLEECASCRAAVREGDELRSFFSESTPSLSAATEQAIRFQLAAAARAAAKGRRGLRSHRSSWRWIAAAVGPLLVLTVGALAMVLPGSPDLPIEKPSQPKPTNLPSEPEAPAPVEVDVRSDEPTDADTITPASRPRAPLRRPATKTASPSEPAPRIDDAFASAWRMFQSGQMEEASRAFDLLLDRSDLGARRADVLFWSGKSHLRAGRWSVAHDRFSELLRDYPSSWHAAEARAILEAG